MKNNQQINIAELSAILYYADFLSIQQLSVPVTDTCKYFYIHDVPMNACFIANTSPFYDENNPYFKQSLHEYTTLKNKFGDEGISSFINNICNLKACGCVSGEMMIRCIHQYSPRKRYEKALSIYQEWKNNLTYKHIIKNEDGKSIIANCSKEIAHIEKSSGLLVESSLLEGSRIHDEMLETPIKPNNVK